MRALAQTGSGDAVNPILVGAVIEGRDTIPMVYLDEVEVIAKMPAQLARRRMEWNRLKQRIYKVYPYAVTAGELFKGVDERLEQFGDDKKGRKAFIKDLEARLNKRFKGELSDFTISEGQILVKLIARQTGRPCFHIIKELKGGFSAVIFQSVALLFNNNLRREYDPTGRDAEIEGIVRELEADRYYRYQSQQSATVGSRL
ncbi:MAG: DUF4294 domain-containing protein [Sphingobacteriales bacterium]|nr:MAG: DUF4294 domain-containing protein [Sphingobacteriales bacterium]